MGNGTGKTQQEYTQGRESFFVPQLHSRSLNRVTLDVSVVKTIINIVGKDS